MVPHTYVGLCFDTTLTKQIQIDWHNRLTSPSDNSNN